MPKKKKKVTLVEQIKQAILTKISALSLLIIALSVVVNIAFLQFNGSVSKNGSANIADWVKDNPKAIIESVQNMQIKEMEKKQKERDKIVKEKIQKQENLN